MSISMIRRLDAIEAARKGARGRRIVNFDDYGDTDALAAHDARVREMEAGGFEVLNIIRVHTYEGMDNHHQEPTDIVLTRSYTAQVAA